ncbi:MAG: NUDIX hydrolase [Pseudomonadota bacterium]
MEQEPIPAATLIVFRPAVAGPPDILVVERGAAMAFAGGAIVFPGGRIDAADEEYANRLGRPADAPRITAIRETIEESAVLVGLRGNSGTIDPALGPILQDGLLGGAEFAAVLDRHGLALDLDALTGFARWMPAFKHARRFDTMFFLAPVLPGSWPPRPQPGECQSAEWVTAAALLTRIEAGADHAIFPTKRNLERLARFASIEEAREDAALHSLDTIIPWIEERDGEPHVCLPAGRGYPVTSEPLATAFRA